MTTWSRCGKNSKHNAFFKEFGKSTLITWLWDNHSQPPYTSGWLHVHEDHRTKDELLCVSNIWNYPHSIIFYQGGRN